MPCLKKQRNHRISNRLSYLERYIDRAIAKQPTQHRDTALEPGSLVDSEICANGSTSIELEENGGKVSRVELSRLEHAKQALAESRSEMQQAIEDEYSHDCSANAKAAAPNKEVANIEVANVITGGTATAEMHQLGQVWTPIVPDTFHDTAFASEYRQASDWTWQRPPNSFVNDSDLILQDGLGHAPPDFRAIKTTPPNFQTSLEPSAQMDKLSAQPTFYPQPVVPTHKATTPPLFQANDADPARDHCRRRPSQDRGYCIDRQRKSRGRPKDSKNKEKSPNDRHQKIRRGPGRPPGSKNKPKMKDSIPIGENTCILFEGGPPPGSNSKTNMGFSAPIVEWMPHQYKGEHQEQGEMMFFSQNPPPPLMFDPWIETMDWRHLNAWGFWN